MVTVVFLSLQVGYIPQNYIEMEEGAQMPSSTTGAAAAQQDYYTYPEQDQAYKAEVVEPAQNIQYDLQVSSSSSEVYFIYIIFF